jgi:hypothetical protein
MTLERDRDRGRNPGSDLERDPGRDPGRDNSGRRVPTLTEVISPLTGVDLLLDVPSALTGSAAADSGVAGDAGGLVPFTKSSVPSISALLATVDDLDPAVVEESPQARVLAQMQRQLDASFDAQLREALWPILQRTAELLIRETREQLTGSLRQAIENAVAQELARHRKP